MNDPKDIAIDPAEMFAWLRSYKVTSGQSWSQIARHSGIPSGTLSAVGNGSYTGNSELQARRIYQFRQTIESQEARRVSALRIPDFVETPTAQRILGLIERAHMGRITVAAMGPGTSKTMAARHYKASASNTFLATMRRSTAGVAGMIAQVAAALQLETRTGWTRQRSAQIASFLAARETALLIVDEANHLEWAAFEELRGWHDETGVGLCFLGNEELAFRIRGGAHGHAFARLNSRIAHIHIQDLPIEADVAAFVDTFQLEDDNGHIRKRLTKLALDPSSGGLREVRQILESAHMLAIADGTIVTLDHVEEAIANRATRQLRRSA